MQYIRVRLTNALSKPPYINCCIVATSDYPGFETATISNFHAATFAAFPTAPSPSGAFHCERIEPTTPYREFNPPGPRFLVFIGFQPRSQWDAAPETIFSIARGISKLERTGCITNRRVLSDRVVACLFYDFCPLFFLFLSSFLTIFPTLSFRLFHSFFW